MGRVYNFSAGPAVITGKEWLLLGRLLGKRCWIIKGS